MKIRSIILAAMLAFAGIAVADQHPREWRKVVQIPPCAASQNLEIIWPKEFHGSVTIECNNLPAK